MARQILAGIQPDCRRAVKDSPESEVTEETAWHGDTEQRRSNGGAPCRSGRPVGRPYEL